VVSIFKKFLSKIWLRGSTGEPITEKRLRGSRGRVLLKVFLKLNSYY
jgi:hypothetical protein